jgi:lysophospholipase L1-like esterase
MVYAFALVALLAALHASAAPPKSETAIATPELPFEEEFRAFTEADRANPPALGGVLFVGSSIFRQWTNVAEMMTPLPVLNRAFGGSRTGDQLARFEQVVSPYAPKVIVYYCGSNDLKAGDLPDAVFNRFQAFSERVHRGSPETHIVFVSSTRAPDRVGKWDRVDRYNALVREYCSSTPNVTFVDVNPVLFDRAGKPRLELYQDDQLHFLPPAYVEFADIIKPVVTRVWEATTTAVPPKETTPQTAIRE